MNVAGNNELSFLFCLGLICGCLCIAQCSCHHQFFVASVCVFK